MCALLTDNYQILQHTEERWMFSAASVCLSTR